MFGRSGDLRQLDAALRAADLHPALVPEGVKLAIVNLMKDRWPEDPPASAYPDVAALLSYCVAGPETFEMANGHDPKDEAERRIENALDAPESLDAEIVLLALHARLMNVDVIDRFDLSAGQA